MSFFLLLMHTFTELCTVFMNAIVNKLKFTCKVFIVYVQTILAPLDSTNDLTEIIVLCLSLCPSSFVSVSCSLKNIIGPLRLNMSDVSTDLNNLVRTFRSVQHKYTLLSLSAGPLVKVTQLHTQGSI